MDGHARFRAWLHGAFEADEPVGLSDVALSGFLRVVTHPRIFNAPDPIARAMEFVDEMLAHPRAMLVRPGPRHWEIFRRLCIDSGARGNLVPDAYLAALAIESGSEFITTDRDFARFPGLRWRHPLTGR
jgi:uncharacterized protein